MLDTEVKPKQKRGKINLDRVVQGVLNNEKKIDIAVAAGSLAGLDSNKAKAIIQVQETQAYKDKTKGILEGLKKELQRQTEAIARANIDSVEYKDLVGAQEKTLKMAELLDGKPTERLDNNIKDLNIFLSNS